MLFLLIVGSNYTTQSMNVVYFVMVSMCVRALERDIHGAIHAEQQIVLLIVYIKKISCDIEGKVFLSIRLNISTYSE